MMIGSSFSLPTKNKSCSNIIHNTVQLSLVEAHSFLVLVDETLSAEVRESLDFPRSVLNSMIKCKQILPESDSLNLENVIEHLSTSHISAWLHQAFWERKCQGKLFSQLPCSCWQHHWWRCMSNRVNARTSFHKFLTTNPQDLFHKDGL